MSPLGSVNSVLPGLRANQLDGIQSQPRLGGIADGLRPAAAPTESFGTMLDGLVQTVSTKQSEAAELTKKVLLGDSDQLHQSVIAMQEASVAFTMMVEVRNKLVESYQELMRMQV
jgi:flagellar hook-basal body complex protein FliE